MSLDVIGCWWLALLRKNGQGMSRQSTNTLQIHQPKVLQKSTSSAITSQGAPLNKKITVSQQWFMATHILATHLPFTKPHPCHLGRCTKRAGLSRVKICSRANCVLLCYTTDIAAASEYRSVQSNTYAGMTSDASSVICKKGGTPQFYSSCQ